MAEFNEGMGRGDTDIGIELDRDGDADITALRADIRDTRERMGQTVEDIGHRLNPDRLKQRFKDDLHDATIGKAEHMAKNAAGRVDATRHSFMDHIRENPIPSAMVGIGLGWLLFNSRRDYEVEPVFIPDEQLRADYGPYDEYYPPMPDGQEGEGMIARGREKVSELKDSALEAGHDVADRARDRVSGIAHETRHRFEDITDRAQDRIEHMRHSRGSMEGGQDVRMRAHRLENRFEETLHDSPLAVGAAAVAIGMAIGLSAPATKRESEIMGDTRDRLLDNARDAAREAREKVGERVEQFTHMGDSGHHREERTMGESESGMR